MIRKLLLIVPVALLAGIASLVVYGSDHDDGETPSKGRSVNLTDLFVFREGDQSGNPLDNANLIFIMNTNPRSLARQQYYWATNARYEFHVSRRVSTADAADGADHVILRFEFGAPNASSQQALTVTALRDGAVFSTATTTGGGAILTSPIGNPTVAVNSDFLLGGSTLRVFAGLRQDPFFFDVEQFFRVRAGLAGTGPSVGFRPTTSAVDFTAGYNVNSLIVRVPIAFLQGTGTATIFDVWETISVLQ